jgi:hypothetical protein
MHSNQSLTHEDFLKVINASFFDPSERTRTTNESILTNLMKSRPNDFVDLCTSSFCDDRIPLNLRKTVGTVLKMAVRPLQANFEMNIWKVISEQKKEAIKVSAITCLIDSNPIIRGMAADLVADVFYVDCMYQNTWGDLLPTLTSNLDHKDYIVQKSAIMTLGYICERLFKGGMNPLNEKDREIVFTGICKKLQNYDENTITSLKSLEYSLNFMTNNLKDQNTCDYIMNLIMTNIKEANNRGHGEVVLQGLLCLNEMIQIIGGNFDRYLGKVVDELFSSYGIQDPKLFISLNDFFQTLLVPKKDNIFIGLFSNKINILNEKILQSLIAYVPEELDTIDGDEQLEVIQSSVLVMGTANTSLLADSYENLLNFSMAYIEKEDLSSKIIALMVLESMICFPGNDNISTLIQSMFQGLHSFFSSNNTQLQIATVNVLKNISLHYPNTFMQTNNFNNIFDLFISFFKNPSRNDRLSSNITLVFENLSSKVDLLHVREKDLLLGSIESLLTTLFVSAERCHSLHLIDRFFSTSMAIFDKVIPHQDYNKWFELLWNQLASVVKFELNDRFVFYIESMFINLNVIVQKMIFYKVDFEESLQIDNKIMEIFDLVYDLFEKQKEIIVEPLLFLSSMIEKEAYNCRSLVHNFLSKYVQTTLNVPDRQDLFNAGITCLGNLVKVFGTEMELYLSNSIPFLINNLNNGTHSEDTKIRLFFTLSDILAHCPKAIIPNFLSILEIIDNAFKAVLIIQDEPNSENMEFADALKETLVEVLLCILHGIYLGNSDPVCCKNFNDFFPRILEFGDKTTKKKYNPAIDYLKDFLMLVTDYMMENEGQVRGSNRLTTYLYDQLSRFRDNRDVQEVLSNYDRFIGV